MRRRVLLIFAVLFLPSMLWAQKMAQQLSLKQAVEYAIEHNKQLKASRKDIDLYREKVREAVSQGLPQIAASVNYSTNFGEELDFGGMKSKLKDQSVLSATINQLVFSGEWIIGIQTSKIAEHLTVQQVGLTELDITENVYDSYYIILVAQRTALILEQNLENMNDILTHTQNMYKAGVAEITDVDQIQITVGQLQNSLLSMKRTIDVNYNLLRIQLGLEASTPIALTQTLNEFLDNGDFARLAVQKFEMTNNAQYQLMETQQSLSKKMVGLKRWAFAPTVGATYNYQHQLKEGGFLNIPHSASVTMSVPIFSGLQRKASLEQTKIQLEQTNINRDLLHEQLDLQDEQLKFDLKNAIENYNLQKSNISVAKRVLANIQNKFEQGVASSLDLTQANNNYLEAESNYNSSCLALLQAQTKIEKLYNILNK